MKNAVSSSAYMYNVQFLVISAGGPSAHRTRRILEHFTKECKDVALRRQAAQPGQSVSPAAAGLGLVE